MPKKSIYFFQCVSAQCVYNILVRFPDPPYGQSGSLTNNIHQILFVLKTCWCKVWVEDFRKGRHDPPPGDLQSRRNYQVSPFWSCSQLSDWWRKIYGEWWNIEAWSPINISNLVMKIDCTGHSVLGKSLTTQMTSMKDLRSVSIQPFPAIIQSP